MADVYWPATLPLKIRYGAEQEFEPEGSKSITDFDGGNKLRRNRFLNAPMLLSTTLFFTDSQYEEFLRFYLTDLNKGIRSFIAPVLSRTEIEYRRCSFDNPSIKATAADYNRWTIPVVFEVRGVVPLSDTTFWFQAYYGDFSEPFCDYLQIIVNEDYPEAVDPYR